MTAGSWPEFLGLIGTTVLLYSVYRICRPAAGRHVLRGRPASGDAHPDGTAAAPAAAAVPLTLDDFWEWRQRGLPDASGREPGACLTSIDPGILAYLRAGLGIDTRRLP